MDAVDRGHEGFVEEVEEVFAPLEFLEDGVGRPDFHKGEDHGDIVGGEVGEHLEERVAGDGGVRVEADEEFPL